MANREEALAAADAAIAAAGVAKAFIAAADPTSPPPASIYLPPVDCLAGTMPAATGYEPTAFENSMRAVLSGQDVPPGSEVYIGDSLTQRWGVSMVSSRAWNAGIAGEPTIGLRGRLSMMPMLHSAGCVIWYASSYNDLLTPTGGGPGQRWWNIQEQITAILAAFTGPLVAIVPPQVDASISVGLTLVNQHLVGLLTGRAHTAIIDGQAVLADPATGYLRTAWRLVGPHLNAAGYQQINPLVQQKIALVAA